MKRVRVIWSDNAGADLQEIERYIARNAPRTAREFVKRLRESVSRLRRFPESGGVVEEIDWLDMRQILFGNYRIFYRFDGRRVEIARVFRGPRLIHPKDFQEND